MGRNKWWQEIVLPHKHTWTVVSTFNYLTNQVRPVKLACDFGWCRAVKFISNRDVIHED